MKAEEKAKELIERFLNTQLKVIRGLGVTPDLALEFAIAKQCALICVDEILKEVELMDEKWHDNEGAPLTSVFGYSTEYWEQVHKEIEKL